MRTLTTLVALLALAGAQAQEKPAPVAPPPADLEPAVDTTRSLPATPAPAPALAPAPAPARAPALAPKSDSAASAPSASAAAGKPGAPRTGKGADRVELETTDITGNRELPKVLYIVPWRRSDLGDLVGKPPNSLLDEVLQPIDRDVFLRENRYYDALKPDAAAPKGGTVPGSGEKP